MANPEVAGSQENPVESFSRFAIEQATRFHDLSVFLTRATEFVSDLEKVNAALDEAGRSDLIINKPAEMDSCNTLKDIQNKTNNFASKFIMNIGRRETGETSRVTNEPIFKNIPITEAELDEIQELPVNTMPHPELIDSVQGTNLYFVFSDVNHALKPAFTRMLILFPEFTKKLVIEMSEADYNEQFGGYFLPEVFAAYQLMSKLVEVSDLNLQEGETANPRYLCI